MKIALFSDIHANLPALEAVLSDIETQQPDAIYCLGDLVGYNVWPNEVVDMIRRKGIPTIAGNYDEGVGNNSDDCGCAYKTESDKANGVLSISYTNSIMSNDNRQYLKELPRHIRLSFGTNDAAFDLLLVHGSPRRINEYLFEDRDAKSMIRIMAEAQADIMCFGHTHKPYHRVLEDGEGKERHAINIGSVGKPKDGDSRACYVLLSVDETGLTSVEFCRVIYDVEKAAMAVEASVLPDVFAHALQGAL
jgi:putative phosphoesterase